MQLEATIGVLDMEIESFERAKLFSWIFFPTWILLTIIQAFCFVLSNGRFHLGCPTTYSCHVDLVLLNSKFEANRSEY